MNWISLDIGSLCEACEDAIEEVVETFDDSGIVEDDAASPVLLASAMRQFMDVLKRVDTDLHGVAKQQDSAWQGSSSLDISELGDYGLSLLNDLIYWAEKLNLEQSHQQLRTAAYPLALWLARHGAELRNLEPIVDGIAYLANTTSDTQVLEDLCAAMGEIIAAVSPTLQQDLENSNPNRPWRVLNLNRGIVATRTHNPAVMEAAFRVLIANLPDDAPEFFREGMLQMDALDYPEIVRRMMEKYYRQWSMTKTLH
jgi:hypothetical protein